MARIDLTGTLTQTQEEFVRTHPYIRALLTKSPTEIETWMLANVTDLVTARDVLINLAMVVSILAKRELGLK